MSVGDTVTIEIGVVGVTDLFGAEVHLTFDPNILQVLDADASRPEVQIQGGPLLDPGRAWVVLNFVDNTAGQIGYALSLISPAPPVSGDGVLASITFETKTQGTATLSFTNVLLVNNEAQKIASVANDGIIAIVPKP